MTENERLVWWVKCPNCGLELHIADLGHEVVELGQKVYLTCPDCETRIKKVVGKDLGKIVKGIVRTCHEIKIKTIKRKIKKYLKENYGEGYTRYQRIYEENNCCFFDLLYYCKFKQKGESQRPILRLILEYCNNIEGVRLLLLSLHNFFKEH